MRHPLSLPTLACFLLHIAPAMAATLPNDGGKKVISRVETADDRLATKTFEVVPGKESPWSFTIEPYAWLPGLAGDIGVGGLPPVNIDYDAGSVFSAFQWGAFLKSEARYGRWGLLADGMFVDIESQVSTPGPLYDNTSVAIQQGLAQLALAYRLWEDRRGFIDVYAGGRYNYYGISISADLNTDAVAQIGTDVTERVSAAIAGRVQSSSLGSSIETFADTLATEIGQAVANEVVSRVSDSPPTLTNAQKRALKIAVSQVQGELNGLIRAQAQAKIAAAAGTLSQGVSNAVTSAEKKLAKALSKKLTNVLPTGWDGDHWWIDPIIGVRAQVNLTRWLYLATQCDVGGFGAGSRIAWNLNGAVGVNFTRHLFGEVGYRYYYLDYSQSGLLYRVAEAGVFIGGGVKF